MGAYVQIENATEMAAISMRLSEPTGSFVKILQRPRKDFTEFSTSSHLLSAVKLIVLEQRTFS